MANPPHPPIPLPLQQRALLDLASRVKFGALAYPVVWLVLAYGLGLGQQQPALVLGVSLALLLIGLGRLLMTRSMPWLAQHHLRPARALFRVLLLLHVGLWGGLCALSQHWPPAQQLETHLLIVGGALLQGGVGSLSLDRVLRLSFPLVGLAPVVLAALLRGQPNDLLLVVLCTLLLAYILATSRRVGCDYWDAQFARATAEHRAQQLEHISRTDALTAIPNRLAFNEQLAIEWQRARRDGSSVAVAMIDLDHFKQINDIHGHAVGDSCLAAAAQALRTALLRPSDSVARYGGEEFVALLPATSLAGARNAADRLAISLRQCQVLVAGQAVPLRCSIGVHALTPGRPDQPEHAGTDVHSLLRGADQALYHAKHAGRNCVVAFGPEVLAAATPRRGADVDPVPADHAAV